MLCLVSPTIPVHAEPATAAKTLSLGGGGKKKRGRWGRSKKGCGRRSHPPFPSPPPPTSPHLKPRALQTKWSSWFSLLLPRPATNWYHLTAEDVPLSFLFKINHLYSYSFFLRMLSDQKKVLLRNQHLAGRANKILNSEW
jgi:hypothetical protein